MEQLVQRKVYELDFTPNKWQDIIEQSATRFTVIEAGRRSGKSIYAVAKAAQYAATHKNVMVWYIGPTYDQTETIAWAGLKQLVPRSLIRAKNEAKLRLTLVNGSVIQLKGADSEHSLRGVGAFLKLGYVVIEEAAYQKEGVWEEVVRPPLTDSKGGALLISSPKGRGWFWKLGKRAQQLQALGDKNWSYHHFTIYDNDTIDRDEIELARSETSARRWRQEYLAEADASIGLVYQEFEERIHVLKEPIPIGANWWKMRACDWGIHDPTACLWLCIDPITKLVYVTQEHYQAGWTVWRHAEEIKRLSRGVYDGNNLSVIDPSANRREAGATVRDQSGFSSVLKGFAEQGIHFLRADNRRDHGIELVRRFLEHRAGSPSLFFFPGVHNLLSEISTYCYRAEESGEAIADGNDHACDALRYAICEIYRLGVSRIRPGVAAPTAVVAQVAGQVAEPWTSADPEHPHNAIRRRKLQEYDADLNFDFYQD